MRADKVGREPASQIVKMVAEAQRSRARSSAGRSGRRLVCADCHCGGTGRLWRLGWFGPEPRMASVWSLVSVLIIAALRAWPRHPDVDHVASDAAPRPVC